MQLGLSLVCNVQAIPTIVIFVIMKHCFFTKKKALGDWNIRGKIYIYIRKPGMNRFSVGQNNLQANENKKKAKRKRAKQ